MVMKKKEAKESSHTGKIVVPQNSMWEKAIKNLVERGELDVESANKCLRRLK